MSKILVIGSSNTDLIATVDRFPLAGETILGSSFLQTMGGKGANQALAAHRAGGDVLFVTCLGNDAHGLTTLNYYKGERLRVQARLIDNAPTGTAMILVNKEAENVIIVTPGANHRLDESFLEEVEKEFASASYVMLQMEIPFATIEAACSLAVRHGVRVVMNVAPARRIGSLISKVDILVVNENEIEMISGRSLADGEEIVIDQILAQGARTVILTLGSRGCHVKGQDVHFTVPAFAVTPTDTTAAGDTFCGALVAQLSKGSQMRDAVHFATASSAICVTRMGAQPSIPHENEVIDFINKNRH